MAYKVQVDDVVRDATPEEVEVIEAEATEILSRAKAEADAATAKAALLERLGITAEEAALLLK